MNRSRIEWTDFTWNPVVGCSRGCAYCYARRIAKPRGKCQKCRDFKPHLHPERLDDPVRRGKPAKIFVCSMGELFDPALPGADIERVADACYRASHHTYQLLTKQPDRMAAALKAHQWPREIWAGVSVESPDVSWRINALGSCQAAVRFVSFEPLLRQMYRMSPYNSFRILGPRLEGVDWIIIGAQTGPGAQRPDPAWVRGIITTARYYGCRVFLKDNLKWRKKIQEWPAGYGE